MSHGIPIGDLNQIIESIESLTRSITAEVTDDFGKFFTDLAIRLRLMERQVEEYKRFIPIIYPQIQHTNTIADGIFDVNIGPYTPSSQSLIMFLPKEASITGDNKLRFFRDGNKVVEFDMYKESNIGQLIKISKSDIVPNRTVMFRLIYNQLALPRAVIINTSGLYNENVSNLYVSGEVLFGQLPLISNSVEPDRLVSKTELDTLKTELDTFKSQFIFTERPAKEVAEDPDTPDGSIIMEIEHD